MNSVTRDQFFELLKAGLWVDYTPNVAVFSDSVDWSLIFKLAKEQTVAGVMWDGLQKLPNELFPPKSIKMSWIALVMTIEKMNKHHNEVIVELMNLYKENGIDAALMKGQSMAANYPNTLHRTCGDIDIYVGKDGYGKVEGAVADLNVEWSSESSKHRNFKYKGITVENHRLFMDEHSTSDRALLKTLVDKWYPNNASFFSISGESIMIPPADFNVMFIFSHLYHHYLTSGVGLRQLCDWVLLMYKYEKELPNMKSKRSGWEVFGYIAVNSLGLPKEKFPDYTEKVKRRARYADKLIFEYGNFGKNKITGLYRTRPKQYYLGKLYSFNFRMIRFFKMTRTLALGELIGKSSSLFYNSIKAVFKDKF